MRRFSFVLIGGILNGMVEEVSGTLCGALHKILKILTKLVVTTG